MQPRNNTIAKHCYFIDFDNTKTLDKVKIIISESLFIKKHVNSLNIKLDTENIN